MILVHSSLRAPPPEIRPRSGPVAKLGEEVERVSEPEGDALEDGADERAAVVADAQAGERAAGVGIGVGSALAGEVGEEDEALGSRRPVACLAPAVASKRRLRRGRVAQPRERTGRGEHHAHGVPGAGRGVAEGVHAGFGVGGERVERGEHDARGAERHRHRARAGRPPRRARRRPGRRRRRRRACRPRSRRTPPGSRVRSGANPGRSRARRGPRRSRCGARRRAAACPRRPTRRWRARRSGAGVRSPWAARSGRCVRRRPARGGAATGASAR